jgi:hypothetical protein
MQEKYVTQHDIRLEDCFLNWQLKNIFSVNYYFEMLYVAIIDLVMLQMLRKWHILEGVTLFK